MSCLSVVLYVGASTQTQLLNATWDLIRIIFLIHFVFISISYGVFLIVFHWQPYTKRNNEPFSLEQNDLKTSNIIILKKNGGKRVNMYLYMFVYTDNYKGIHVLYSL